MPFFVYSGAMLEKFRVTEGAADAWILLGPLKGGMALAVVIVGTIVAAATGIVQRR